MKRKDAVIDTETTGLPDRGEVRLVSVAIVDVESGRVLLDTLIQPKVPGEDCYPIPARATQIHGISDEDVRDSPDWGIVRDLIVRGLEGYGVLWAYNVDFDAQVIRDHDEAWCRATESEPLHLFTTHSHQGLVSPACAMEWFADPWHTDCPARWVKLGAAAGEAGHDWQGASAHGARSDALACRSVILYLEQMNRQGIPCHLCGQPGRPSNPCGHAYCRECIPVMCFLADTIQKTPNATVWGSRPSNTAWKKAKSAMEATLDEKGLTIPASWFGEARKFLESELSEIHSRR